MKFLLITGVALAIIVVLAILIEFMPPTRYATEWGRTSVTILHEYTAGESEMEVFVTLKSDYLPPAQEPNADKVAVSVRSGVLHINLLPVTVVKKRWDLKAALSGNSDNTQFRYAHPLLTDKKLYSAIVISQNDKEVRYNLQAVPETGLVRVESTEGDTSDYWPKITNQDPKFGSPKITARIAIQQESPTYSSRQESIIFNGDDTLTRKALLEKCPELPASALITYQQLAP